MGRIDAIMQPLCPAEGAAHFGSAVPDYINTQLPNNGQPLKPEPITEEIVDVIKVYLKAGREVQGRMFSDDVSQVQEVRYCLKSLREQMAARSTKCEHKDEKDHMHMKEDCKRLQARLQDIQKHHQEEQEKLQAEVTRCHQRFTQQAEHLREFEKATTAKDCQIQELHQVLGCLEQERDSLQVKIKDNDEELRMLRAEREERSDKNKRMEQLEKEYTTLKEKNHHLDDMLKCQQRKIRHMIGQLQNFQTAINEKERTIQSLQQRVAVLEAENGEMRDQVGRFMPGQRHSTDSNAQVVYSKPLRHSADAGKSLPFIKIIEISS